MTDLRKAAEAVSEALPRSNHPLVVALRAALSAPDPRDAEIARLEKAVRGACLEIATKDARIARLRYSLLKSSTTKAAPMTRCTMNT
jgi:hypothetical protein